MQGSGGQEAPAGVTVVGARSTPRNGRLFRDLLDRFAVLAETCYRFSRDIYHQTGDPPEADLEGSILYGEPGRNDRFHIEVWDNPDPSNHNVVYTADNAGTVCSPDMPNCGVLPGGNIQLHRF